MKNRLPPDEERWLARALCEILRLPPLSIRLIEKEVGLVRSILSHILRSRKVTSGAELLVDLLPAERPEEPPARLTAADRREVRALVQRCLAEQHEVLGITAPSAHQVERRMAQILEET